MAEKHWTYIWHQAITRSFMNGKAFGRDRTAVFSIKAPVSGTKIRLRFSNIFGNEPYEFGTVRVYAGSSSAAVTLNGKGSFQIPAGGVTVSDECGLAVRRGEEIQIRLFYTNYILDNNMIEEKAGLFAGNRTQGQLSEPMPKPLLAKVLGAYSGVPSLEAAEVLTDDTAKAIVAFGDSIIALGRWTKPLAQRLDEAYGGEYVLLNSGISGNCLLYEPDGLFGPVFGQKGQVRFERDVLEIPNLHAVILGLGVNDVSYLNEKAKTVINRENYIREITAMTETLHSRGVRVVMQTISPRLGVARTMGKYTRDMEKLRLELNEWIRSADIFDYVFDAEETVREERPDGYYYAEGLHQGDHLHPNAEGGRKLAESYDLEKLTGQKI